MESQTLHGWYVHIHYTLGLNTIVKHSKAMNIYIYKAISLQMGVVTLHMGPTDVAGTW